MTLAALAVGSMALLAAACGDVDDAGDAGGASASPTADAGERTIVAAPTADAGGRTSVPPPTPDAGDREIVPAPIDETKLIIRESAPPQYAVRVVSGLPNGCAQFNEAKITGREGFAIRIEVTNTMPSDPNVVCTAIYGTHEEIIELGTDFVSGTEYAVQVNDAELRFTAQ